MSMAWSKLFKKKKNEEKTQAVSNPKDILGFCGISYPNTWCTVPSRMVIACVQELVSYVNGLVRLNLKVAKQSHHTDAFVANVHPCVVASVEGTVRDGRLQHPHFLVDAKDHLVQMLSLQLPSPRALGTLELAFQAAGDDATTPFFSNLCTFEQHEKRRRIRTSIPPFFDLPLSHVG